MRAKEFLSEAGLKSSDFYERYRLANLIDKLVKKESFFTVKGDQVEVPATPEEIDYLKNLLNTSFDSTEPKARSHTQIKMPTKIGGVRLSSLNKTKEFGGTVALSTTGDSDYSKANLGPTVEALKSFAIYAKLSMRDKQDITAEDVIQVGQLAAKNAQEVEQGTSKQPTTLAVHVTDVPDTNKTVKDHIMLKVALSTASFQRAIRVSPADKSAWGNLQGIVKYVNTESDIAKYTRFFANNNKRDPVKISVVGIGGAKTDISTTYGEGDNGKPIQNLSMSVKSAGAEWYDQASGSTVLGIQNFYRIIGLSESAAGDAMREVDFKTGGAKDTPEEWQHRVQSVTNLYTIAYNQLKTRIPQLNDKGEADYIHSFLGNLKSSLAGDERLVYVKFDANGTYEKLKPHLLSNLGKVIDLDVNLSAGGTQRPRIFWYDKKTGKTLIYVVLTVGEGKKRLTHQFNLGKDFFELLREAGKLTNQPSAEEPPAPNTNQPVAATKPTTPNATQPPVAAPQPGSF